jgi:hypothetical protein
VASIANCPCCNSRSKAIKSVLIQKATNAELFQCITCGHLFFPNPSWLDKAYSSAIARTDTGLVARNLMLRRLLFPFLLRARQLSSREESKFLDFGCGTALFVRMMRDLGLDFYGFDDYSHPVHAPAYVYKDIASITSEFFEVITLCEVLEHLTDPLKTLKELRDATQTFLVTTECIPEPVPSNSWPYYDFDTGQHISFFTLASLASLASQLNCTISSYGRSIHLISGQQELHEAFRYFVGYNRSKILFTLLLKLGLKSLTLSDHYAMKSTAVNLDKLIE